MMSSLEMMVRQFNEVYEVEEAPKPKLPTEEEATLCNNLIHEELMELNTAFDDQNIIEIADAITDIIYVTAQQGAKLGLPIDALLREVQRSNMSKLDEQGKPIRRADGKVLKGPNFSEPDIVGVLMEVSYGS